MSTRSSSASPRPTLPGIQALLPDDQFYKLSAMPTRTAQTIANVNGSDATAPSVYAVQSDSSGRKTGCVSVSGSTASPASPPRQSPGGVRRGGAATATRAGPTTSTEDAFHGPSPGVGCPVPLPYPPHVPARSPSTLQIMHEPNLPTYVIPAGECSPDDDRRHGCGICHRRFNRPSSLRIHMNSHTGEQPFECPFPGCSRRFSVNSNMRRHYRNHREGHTFTPPAPLYGHAEQSHMFYRMTSSPTSTLSSFSDAEEHSDTPTIAPGNNRLYHSPQIRTRSLSEVFPPRGYCPGARPRSCTVPGCDCNEAPMALRPAFQQGSSSRPFARSS
ncbi:hypothetical protein BC628DRAFT_831637 [Trametes gibbosa]|uniref:C2H2-type domain-containing protein n=1 Tax=Trametes gibbosa TaxID=160864 RepID=A0A6G6FQF2_9APHY|nr:hypothetical protein BC628DRAFT_831637 [Trametes gibbosa]QIE48413.1 hypothetical protein [Trametes gibbosa]